MQPFQSTPPGWEATRDDLPAAVADRFQSTPPGWEATRTYTDREDVTHISIHASRVGGDRSSSRQRMHRHPFQSTPPGWEATTRTKVKPISAEISIHASRVGGDQRDADRRAEDINFNPHLPGGRRPAEIYRRLVARGFQSTPPGWEATVAIDLRLVHRKQFQSTPPGWEATQLRQLQPHNISYCNPRLPSGRRQRSTSSRPPSE